MKHGSNTDRKIPGGKRHSVGDLVIIVIADGTARPKVINGRADEQKQQQTAKPEMPTSLVHGGKSEGREFNCVLE